MKLTSHGWVFGLIAVLLPLVLPAQEPERITMSGVAMELHGEVTVTRHFLPYYDMVIYVPRDTADLDSVRGGEAAARIIMTWLLPALDEQGLASYWDSLLRRGGVSDLEFQQLAPMRDRFHRYFAGAKANDVFEFEYLPDSGLKLIVAGEEKGTMAGLSFNRWMLGGWLAEFEKAR